MVSTMTSSSLSTRPLFGLWQVWCQRFTTRCSRTLKTRRLNNYKPMPWSVYSDHDYRAEDSLECLHSASVGLNIWTSLLVNALTVTSFTAGFLGGKKEDLLEIARNMLKNMRGATDNFTHPCSTCVGGSTGSQERLMGPGTRNTTKVNSLFFLAEVSDFFSSCRLVRSFFLSIFQSFEFRLDDRMICLISCYMPGAAYLFFARIILYADRPDTAASGRSFSAFFVFIVRFLYLLTVMTVVVYFTKLRDHQNCTFRSFSLYKFLNRPAIAITVPYWRSTDALLIASLCNRLVSRDHH